MTEQITCCASGCCNESRAATAKAHQTSSWKPLDEGSGGERGLHVLSLLNAQNNGEVTFQGLKRKLGWHQEIVSRTLRRLERDGLLLKTPSGAYRLNPASSSRTSSQGDMLREDITPVTQLWLPKDLDTDTLTSLLRNTWFGGWRWYGCRADNSEQVLTWISEDGYFWINLRILNGIAFVEAGPAGSAGRDRCLYAGYDLLGHLVKRYRSVLAGSEQMLLQPN
ncbi:MAG: hypothetical protein M1503_12765 [Thaumarchaeota archaeon]|nr:hypothetical protein [Nitrososphaerota archaeon]MCL5319111.1 hypothetical protein [Nitrososphaerota archaeon]